jgi:acetolactate synthase-1/2/3 large subunit
MGTSSLSGCVFGKLIGKRKEERKRLMDTCSQIIAQTLKDLGVRRMFGLPGGEILDLIEAGRGMGLEFVATRHEVVAAFMADVTGQIMGTPGVCLSTLGPGATNLISGVANAYLDRSPVLAFTAQLSSAMQPYASHQFISLEELFRPVTKKVFTLSANRTEQTIREGFRLATRWPKGPVCFCLPSDVAKMEETRVPDLSSGVESEWQETIDEKLISHTIQEICNAKTPLIILGIGIDPAKDTDVIRDFILRTGIPVLSTPKAKGIFPESNALYLGTASGMMADELVVDLIMKADLVIGLGFDPVESDKIWYKDVNLLSINRYSIRYRNYSPFMEVIGDIKRNLELLMRADFSKHAWNRTDLEAFKVSMARRLAPTGKPRSGLFSPYQVVVQARKALSDATVITTDVGAHKLLMGQVWKPENPLTFLMSNGLSSMGYGFPAAMAAKLCFPRSQVVCFTGDGGFAMNLQDLETAVRLNLPVVTIVLCDGSFSLIEVIQKKRGYPRKGVNFEPIKFASVAEGFGARGVRLGSIEELPGVLSAGFLSSRPTVVEVPVDGSEYEEQL